MHLHPKKARKGGKGEGLLHAVGISNLEKHSTEQLLCTFDVLFRHGLGTFQFCLYYVLYQSCIPVPCHHTHHSSHRHGFNSETCFGHMRSNGLFCASIQWHIYIQTHTCSMACARCRTLLVNVVKTYVPIFVAAATRHCPSLAVTWTLVTQTSLQSTPSFSSFQSHIVTSSSQLWMWVQGPICIWYVVWQLGRKQSGRYWSPPDDY